MTFFTFIAVVLSQPLPPNHPAVPDAAAPTAPGTAPSADELIAKLEQLEKTSSKDKPFELLSSLGRLYYGQGRYADAVKYYEQAVEKAEPLRSLYLAQLKATAGQTPPSAVDAKCAQGPHVTQSQLLADAEDRVRRKEPLAALACAKTALHGLVETETYLGHAKFLLGDPAGAIAVYDRAVATFERNLEARYARGATLLDSTGDDITSLQKAKADLSAVAEQQAEAPRGKQAKRLLERCEAAIAAGGLSKLAPPAAAAGAPPALSPETIAAFQNTPKTAESDARYAKLIADGEDALSKGQAQQALDAFKQVMPYQPENPRLRAGMAWSLIQLGKPMGERVWQVASQDPEAVAALGDTLKAKGDAAGAKALWLRLAQTVPSYAPKLEARTR